MGVLRDAEQRRRTELCSEVSAASGERLAATASRIDHWLLVEYRHVWSRDTVGGSGLADEVKAHLRAQVAALPRTRLLFIRRVERRRTESLALYYGRSTEDDRRLYELELEGYDELLAIDLPARLERAPSDAALVEHPLLVVCTHGKRDRCCAKYGRPLYEEVRAQADPGWVWQSTHVGGDRFAGNLVCLPEGLYYGRVERSDVWELLDEHLAGRIHLPRYRGRSCYPFTVQAAERRIREETGLTGIDDLALAGVETRGDNQWRVTFLAAGELHVVDVVEELGELTYLTCDAVTPRRPRRYSAVSRHAPATA